MSNAFSPSVRPPDTACERRYAMSDVAPREVLVFKSMVRLLDGQTRDRWTPSDPALAQLLVTTHADDVVCPGLPRLQLGGSGDHAMARPLRADALRAQLDRVSGLLLVLPGKATRPRLAVAEEFRRLELLRWPCPMLLRHEPHYAHLATLLGVGPCSMDDLSVRAGVPLDTCHAFAARLHASGTAQWLIDPPAAPSLLSKLRATLGVDRSA